MFGKPAQQVCKHLRPFRGGWVAAVAGLGAGLALCISLLLTALPQLHACLHTESVQSQHHCLVTELAGGGFDAGTAPAAVLRFTLAFPVPTPGWESGPAPVSAPDPFAPRGPPASVLPPA